MIKILQSGGLLMIPIFLCAFAVTFIIIERFIYFMQLNRKDPLLYKRVRALIKVRDFTAAKNLCSEAGTPAAAVLNKLIQCRAYSTIDLKEAVLTEASRQIPKLERFLTSLGTIANISTLLGLLGTVTGNIGAFGVLGEAGTMGNPALLAGAIAEALVTTASGLGVSIPAIIFHNYFASRTNRIILGMEADVSDLVMLVQGRGQ